MILIGDIHINTRHSKRILESLVSFTEQFSDEKNILFAGDYMYMFSYDRQALGELFDFFLQLREQGRNVYILTGNHDWLNQHFVYHEGKKIADILNNKTDNKIHFITEPEIHTIEGNEILFMPYNKGFLGKYTTEFKMQNAKGGENNNELGPLHSELTTKDTITADILTLLESSNYNEQLSWALNHYLIKNYKKGMTLVHHYYTANISFPGQQAQFDYKDIALHPLRTKSATKVISGHLHKPFIHENYTCLGSVRSTTSGERNQSKFLRRREPSTDDWEAHEITINPYISVIGTTGIYLDTIQTDIQRIQQENREILPHVSITNTPYNLANTSLIIYSPDSIEVLETILDPMVKAQLGDIQLKQTPSQHKDMTELLDITQYNIKESLLDWKELVKKYLMSRYGPESDKYRTLLSELNIL